MNDVATKGGKVILSTLVRDELVGCAPDLRRRHEVRERGEGELVGDWCEPHPHP